MAQCYTCGSSVDEADRFCMECGTPNPAHPPQPGAAQPGNVQPIRPTQPTWFPADGVLPRAQVAPSPANVSSPLPSPAGTIACPRCGAGLPRNAQFCGDCGERLSSQPSGVLAPAQARVAAPPGQQIGAPAAWMPPASISSALPAPIAPPAPQNADRSAPDLARPVLPPFSGSPWAAQPTPEVGIPDHTWTSLSKAQPVKSPSQMFWAQPAPPPASPSGAMPGIMPAQQQGFAGVSFPQVAPPKRGEHPRSQVIILIVATIVTIVSATAGVIVQFFVK